MDRVQSVAITGPTGTFGAGLVPLLEADDRIAEMVGIARRRFDPAVRGWSKMRYERGDVRDPDALAHAFAGAAVVVHLAFAITGSEGRAASRATNVTGTLNAFRAAAAAGAQRFVYASSVAAYGFHPGKPPQVTEEWPPRPADHLAYGQEKAEIEALLAEAAAEHPDVDLYVVRPPIVVGPNSIGAKTFVSPLLDALGVRAGRLLLRSPVPLPAAVPAIPLQLIHEEDVGRALVLCIVGAGPPGTYNIAGDGVLTGVDAARAVGLSVLPLPAAPAQAALRLVAGLPRLAVAEAISYPAIMDTTKACTQLGWRPRYSGIDALRAALDGG